MLELPSKMSNNRKKRNNPKYSSFLNYFSSTSFAISLKVYFIVKEQEMLC